jgi:hypothetical protein
MLLAPTAAVFSAGGLIAALLTLLKIPTVVSNR